MGSDGFMDPAETRAEWAAAEKAMLARRDKEQLAGELTPDEAKLAAASEARIAAASAVTGAALRAVAAARDAVEKPWEGATLKEEETIADAERARSRAEREEEDARIAHTRLSVAINAAGAARRKAAAR